MDFAELQKRFEQSRRCDVTVQGIAFALLLPHPNDVRVAFEEQARSQSAAFRVLLERAITGWQRCTIAHLLQDAPEADAGKPLEYSPEACALLLRARQDITDELTVAVSEERARRLELREAARKNS
jgi:hypothetical protein